MSNLNEGQKLSYELDQGQALGQDVGRQAPGRVIPAPPGRCGWAVPKLWGGRGSPRPLFFGSGAPPVAASPALPHPSPAPRAVECGGHPSYFCRTTHDGRRAMIRHVVLVRFREGVAPGEISAIFGDLADLRRRLPGMTGFAHGPNVSPEGLSRGHTHAFTVDFDDAAARDATWPCPSTRPPAPGSSGRPRAASPASRCWTSPSRDAAIRACASRPDLKLSATRQRGASWLRRGRATRWWMPRWRDAGRGAASTGSTVWAVLATSFGNLIEWYDVYAYSAFALYFAGSFFPRTTRPSSSSRPRRSSPSLS